MDQQIFHYLPPGPGTDFACPDCRVLLRDIVDARHHFSHDPHPISPLQRQGLSAAAEERLIDSRIRVVTYDNNDHWLRSRAADLVFANLAAAPEILGAAAHWLGRAPRNVLLRVFVMMRHPAAAATYYRLDIPSTTQTYIGLVGIFEAAEVGAAALVARGCWVEVSGEDIVKEEFEVRGDPDVLRLVAARVGEVNRRMVIGPVEEDEEEEDEVDEGEGEEEEEEEEAEDGEEDEEMA